jgi:iron-sulfur cluster assembly accessory protein
MSEQQHDVIAADELLVTDSALKEIKRLLADEQESDLFLRLGVRPGGCSGISYVMAFDNTTMAQDRVFEFEGVRVVLDEQAYTHLKGATIEFNKEMIGGGFAVNNPNVKKSCNCGSGCC